MSEDALIILEMHSVGVQHVFIAIKLRLYMPALLIQHENIFAHLVQTREDEDPSRVFAPLFEHFAGNFTLVKAFVDLNSGSAYNQIYENSFYNNRPFQAVDNGIYNLFYRNFWDDWDGTGAYEIAGVAENTDEHPLDECPLGQEPPAPAQAPALTQIGLIALIGLLSIVVALNMGIRKRR